MRNKQIGSQCKWEGKRKRRDGQQCQRSYRKKIEIVKFHTKEKRKKRDLRSELNPFFFFTTLLPLPLPLPRFPSASTITISLPLSIKTPALVADTQNGSPVKPA